MNIQFQEITIRELTEAYKDKQRDAVITTIRKNFPLNVITGQCVQMVIMK